MTGNCDFISDCLDEVALEGLDGITLSALWTRLKKRPNFQFPIDDDSKQFIWEALVLDEDIQLYELPNPRPPLVIFNRYDYLDMEDGVVVEPENMPEDCYPIMIINRDGIRGSCSTFFSRKLITSQVRNNNQILITINDAVEKWGEKLVLVADQSVREIALIGTEVGPCLELSSEQYCMLERIGRSRYQGEVTQGKQSLQVINSSPKTLYYYRKPLLRKGIITKQTHHLKYGNNNTATGSLLHLARFFVEVMPKMQVMLNQLCESLALKPNNREVFHKVRNELGMKEASFKKLFFKPYGRNLKTLMLPYREMYPEASKAEAFTLSGKERLVKVAELVESQENQEGEEYPDEEDKDEDESVGISYDPSKFVYDRSLLNQVYDILKAEGADGISQLDISRKMGLPKLESRLVCRNLERKGVVTTFMRDLGRQRITTYIAKCFEQKSESHKKLLEERKRILELSKDVAQENLPCSSELNISEPIQTATDALKENPEAEHLSKVTAEGPKMEPEVMQSKTHSFSITEEVKHMYDNARKDTAHVTLRMLKRATLVIEAVKKEKLIDDVFKLQKLVIEAEAQEGSLQKVDKKSMNRLIFRLAKDGYVRSIKTILKLGEQVKKLHFVCDPSITVHDALVKSTIEQAKFKYFGASKQQMKNASEKSKLIDGTNISNLSQLQSKYDKQTKIEYVPSIGRVFGVGPKFIRMKTLHLLLYYLVYDYQGVDSLLQEENHPKMYNPERNWKIFIPPLPKHRGFEKGWCLFSDVLLAMPLSIFVKIVNITYKIDGLQEYLNHPIKCHYLVRHIPQHLRNALLYARRYIFSAHEVAMKLSFMGLLSFGPHKHKEKDQMFVYVHRNSSISDTTASPPSYVHVSQDIKYERKHYTFSSIDVVEHYWNDLQDICLHTPLGKPNCVRGQEIPFMNLFKKPAMIEASRNKEPEEILDDGSQPGDNLGAGGLDSSLFAHLKRNWAGNNLEYHLPRKVPCMRQESGQGTVGISYLEYLKSSGSAVKPLTDNKKRLGRLKSNTGLSVYVPQGKGSEKAPLLKVSAESKKKGKAKRKIEGKSNENLPKKKEKSDVTIRKIQGRKTKEKRPFYDEKDKAALMCMSKLRVDWKPEEDSFILLGKVGSCFLNPNYSNMVVRWTVIRDLLHKHLPAISRNKTSRACQRRLRYMMLNPGTVSNVSVFLGEARQDQNLVQEFCNPKPPLTHEEKWNTMFISVMEKLLEKFKIKDVKKIVETILPSTIEELLTKFEISLSGSLGNKKPFYEEPKNIVDIYYSVAQTIVIASLCTVGDKRNWSYILYEIYQQYPENLLRYVVNGLQNDQLIVKRRGFHHAGTHSTPLSSVPYRLSVTFEHTFVTRYQPEIYTEAWELVKEGKTNLTGDLKPGYCAAVIGLMAMRKLVFQLHIPDQIIMLDTNFGEDPQPDAMLQVEKMDMDKKKTTKSDELPAKSSVETEEFVCNNSVTNVVKDYEIVKSNLTANCEKNNPVSSVQFETSAISKASRFALYMMQQQLNQVILANKIQHVQDSFVINSCRITCKLIHTSHDTEASNVTKQSIKDIINSQKIYLPKEQLEPNFDCLEEFYSKNNFPPKDLEICKLIYEYIQHKKEFGATEVELLETFMYSDGILNVKDHLVFLCKHFIILKVGIKIWRYVSFSHTKPWIVSSVKIPKELRPWFSENYVMKSSVKDKITTTTDSLVETLAREDVKYSVPAKKPRLDLLNSSPEKNKHHHITIIATNSVDNTKETHSVEEIDESYGDNNKQNEHSLCSTEVTELEEKDNDKQDLQASCSVEMFNITDERSDKQASCFTDATNRDSHKQDQQALSSVEITDSTSSYKHFSCSRETANVVEGFSYNQNKQVLDSVKLTDDASGNNKNNQVLYFTEVSGVGKGDRVKHDQQALCATEVVDVTEGYYDKENQQVLSFMRRTEGNGEISKLEDNNESVGYGNNQQIENDVKTCILSSKGFSSMEEVDMQQKASTSVKTFGEGCETYLKQQEPASCLAEIDKREDSAALHEDQDTCVKNRNAVDENTLNVEGFTDVFAVASQSSDVIKPGYTEEKEPQVLSRPVRRRRCRGISSLHHGFNCDRLEKVSFVIRPWRKPDGSLNRPILKKMLCAVLSYIMTFPGIKQDDLCDHFTGALKPIYTLELLEILQDLKCVSSFTLVDSHEPSLFSSLIQYQIELDKNHHKDTYYEATVDAILKLGEMIDELISRPQ
ncbi:general transcription factor 3C polypeptide 1 [Tachypleus tridentatus]|uniref:general transcription factor 3C polypeptide 1 n=1 Tax=Tachypleus tridentatus TaxID=6853 RepID=UPI003FD0D39D